jgi:DNA-binding NarL/FixJ family response regulator
MVDIWIMSPSRARRDWLLRSIGSEDNIRIVGQAASFPFLRSLIADTAADLALIDIQSPMRSSVVRDWLGELLELVPIVLLSSDPDSTVFNRILNEKSGGVLSADAPSEQIIQAIKSVASGLMIFDGALLRHAIRGADDDTPSPEPLTPREIEVLRLLADGLGNKEIAARMNISEHTIKFHIRSILGKLGASSRTEAVSRGLRSGLIEL